MTKLSDAERAEVKKELAGFKGDWSGTAQLLLERGADVNHGECENAPLYVSTFVGDVPLTAALIAHGADLNPRRCPESPLHSAIAELQGGVARLLVEKGADPRARNTSRRTPLHFLAVYMQDRELAELLIERGADVNAKDKDGWTPLAYATQAHNDPVADVLRAHGGK